jgi:hypothetical protein
VQLGITVGQADAADVDAGPDQAGELVRGVAGGPDGGDDLRPAGHGPTVRPPIVTAP